MKDIIKKLLHENIVRSIKDDSFIHFTSIENANKIIYAKTLGSDEYSTFAVSAKWGIYNNGAVLPKEGVAILFKTNKLPKYGYVEEVVWAGAVPLTKATILSIKQAVNILKNSELRTDVGEQDIVTYINENVQSNNFLYRGYECKLPFMEKFNAYGCAIYKDGEYKLGFRGPVGSIKTATKLAIETVDRMIKNLINEELSDNLEAENTELNALYAEGKKFFPNLKFFRTKTKNDDTIRMRAFTNYPEDKTSSTIGRFKFQIAAEKVKKIVDWFKSVGVTKVEYSKSTNSIYAYMGDQKIRISDHGTKGFDGINIIVLWNTSMLEVINRLYELL